MAHKKNNKRIIRNRSSMIWMETLEQRQLLAPIFGSAEAAGLNYNNTPPITRDPSLSAPPVGLNVLNATPTSEDKTPLETDFPSNRLIVKIV